MRFFLIILILITCSLAGNVYVSRSIGKAVYITDSKSQADLIVYITRSKSAAKNREEIWYYTDSKSQADLVVYFTRSKSQADLIIFFTDAKSQAGRR